LWKKPVLLDDSVSLDELNAFQPSYCPRVVSRVATVGHLRQRAPGLRPRCQKTADVLPAASRPIDDPSSAMMETGYLLVLGCLSTFRTGRCDPHVRHPATRLKKIGFASIYRPELQLVSASVEEFQHHPLGTRHRRTHRDLVCRSLLSFTSLPFVAISHTDISMVQSTGLVTASVATAAAAVLGKLPPHPLSCPFGSPLCHVRCNC
jgi:hypothetical protein